MKTWYNSRLVRRILLIVGASAVVYLRKYLPEEIAGLLVDEVLAAVGVVAGLGALRLRAQDKRQVAAKAKVTVGEILTAKDAKVLAFHQHGCKGGDCDCQASLDRAGGVSP